MDARPVVQPTLGPISPELALVDPVLAEQARKLLPDPGEFLGPRMPAARVEAEAAPRPHERPEVALPPLAPRPRRRWPRTVALAVLVFAAGAASGSFLRDRHPATPGVALELRTATVGVTGGETHARAPSPGRKAVGQPSAGRTRPSPSRSWAPNVLGVAAQVAGAAVKLVWQPPVTSSHVVVLRALGNRESGTVVFRGDTTRFRDASPRPCTAYRYTIVNYDGSGHRSTGVPTSVVTGGCT